MMLTDQEINSIFRKFAVVDDDGLIYGLQEACSAVIEANNAKLLENLDSIGHQYQNHSDGEWCNFSNEKHYKDTLADGRWNIRSIYSADTVSALIQRNEALEARVKELEDECARWVSLLPNPNKMPTRHFDKLPESFTPDEIGKALGVADRPKATTEQRDTYWKQLERSGER